MGITACGTANRWYLKIIRITHSQGWSWLFEKWCRDRRHPRADLFVRPTIAGNERTSPLCPVVNIGAIPDTSAFADAFWGRTLPIARVTAPKRQGDALHC